MRPHERWLNQAWDDLQFARLGLEEGFHAQACFLSQQVIEAATALAVKVLGAGFAFAFNVLLARMLGAEGAGLYFLALTVTAIASVVARVGLDNTLLRFTAAHSSVGEWAEVKGATAKGIALTTALSLILTVILFAASPWLAGSVFSKPDLAEPLRWMALATLPLSLFSLYAEMLRGLKHIFASQSLQGLLLPIVNVAALYFLARQWAVTGAAAGYLIASTLTALMGGWFWHRAIAAHHEARGNFEWKTLFQSCLPLYGVDLLNRAFIPWTPLLLLGIWAGSAEAGIFGVATRTAGIIVVVLWVVNSIAAPKMAALYRQGDMESLAQIARKTTAMMTLFALPPTLLCLFFPGWVMSLFGERFGEGVWCWRS